MMHKVGPVHHGRGRSRLAALVLTGPLLLLVACSALGQSPPPTSVARDPKPRQPEARTARATPTPEAVRNRSFYDDEAENPTASAAELQQRAQSVDDLAWLPALPVLRSLVPGATTSRSSVLAEKQRAQDSSDVRLQAGANAILASEAFTRASVVVRHWLDKVDPATGLMANWRPSEGTLGWYYQDTSSDLFPHIAIGAGLLLRDRYSEALAVLAAERRLAPPAPNLPDDILLPAGQFAGQTEDRRMFGAAEYAKDALLPLIERLGPDPWLGRLREVTDAILAESATPTKRGPIPAGTNEVNGDVLQTLARAYWATGDERYFAMADRIGRAYVEDMLPKNNWLPVHEWDFVKGDPIGKPRLRLSDHGNEIVSGLVGWHMIESLRGEPDAPAHRVAIRKMLDRILESGRNQDGLWFRVIQIPTGRVDQSGLTDNWGYITQPFLAQAALERVIPDGDRARAERYEEAARQELRGLPNYRFYPWQRGVMDGNADSLESAMYLLAQFQDTAASRWADEQAAVLFGFQAPDGIVEDNYLDGNFVRSALLYGLYLTRGMVPEPWRPGLAVGSVQDGVCVQVALGSTEDWEGRLRFDTPRHQENLHLPIDFQRLNEWPEGFTVSPGSAYQVADDSAASRRVDGAELAAGLPLRLEAGRARALRVCPT